MRTGYFLIWTIYLISTQLWVGLSLEESSVAVYYRYAQILPFAAVCLLLIKDYWDFHSKDITNAGKHDIRTIWTDGLRYLGRHNLENVVLYSIAALLFLLLSDIQSYVILLPFFLLGAEYSPRHWIKPAFFVVGLKLVFQISMVFLGYAEDQVTSMPYAECHSLGFANPNYFGQVILFLFLTGWYLYIDRKWLTCAIGFCAAILVFFISGCRTAAVILFLMPILFAVVSSKGWKQKKRWTDPIVRFFPLLCAGLSFGAGLILAPFDGKIDSNFICRFVEFPYALEDFGLSFFPRELTAPDRIYYFDNYYIGLLFSSGILLFAAFLILNLRLAHVIAKLGDDKVTVLILCVLIYQCMERGWVTPIHYFLLIFLFIKSTPEPAGAPQKRRNYYVCGDWMGARPMGVHRYEMNLLRYADALLREERGLSVSFVIPKDARFADAFDAVSVCRVGYIGKQDSRTRKILSRLWKRVVFPAFVLSRDGIGVDLTLSFPMSMTKVYALHDCIIETYYGKEKEQRGHARRYMNHVRRIAADKTNRIITVSEYSRKEIAGYYHIDADAIPVVGNGWEHIREIEEDPGIFDRLQFTKETPYCFSLGSKYAHKNIEWILRTAKKNPGYRFVISGHAFAGYDQMDDVADNVVLTGYLTDGEIKALMHSCRAFLQPSFMEGFGIPPLEALSLGRPVILSDIEVFREIYQDAAHYIDPYGDGCVVDDILKQSTASPEAVLKKHSWEHAARDFVRVLRDDGQHER